MHIVLMVAVICFYVIEYLWYKRKFSHLFAFNVLDMFYKNILLYNSRFILYVMCSLKIERCSLLNSLLLAYTVKHHFTKTMTYNIQRFQVKEPVLFRLKRFTALHNSILLRGSKTDFLIRICNQRYCYMLSF